MTEGEKTQRKEVADMVAAIERVMPDLALAEEPAGFIAALESEEGDE